MTTTRRSASYLLALVIGIAIGWAVHGRALVPHRGEHVPDLTIESDKHLMVYQPRKPQDAITLVPFAVSRGGERRQWSDAPADPDALWLVSWDDGTTVVSCSRAR